MFSKRRGKKTKVQSPTDRLFATLKTLGLKPSHFIDVGGNHGNWTRAARAAFPDANVTMLEPLPALREKHADLLADRKVAVVYEGAGDFDGVASFTVHERDDSSSFLYSADEAKERGFRQEQIRICQLDTLVGTSDFGAPDVIKIDAEGLDLQVLDGAQQTLAKAEVVLIEATIANKDYPNTLLAVVQKMDGLGFRLFDITDLNRTPERQILWLIEGVFVRKDGALDTAGSTYQ